MTGDDRSDPLSDVLNIFAAPLAGTIRSIDQFRKGVDEFLRGVENFNRTMETLNETAQRINVLLGEIEEPIKAAMPQVTRTVKLADEVMQVVSGPAIAAAPALRQLTEIMSTPGIGQLPAQLGQFTEVMADMSKRLGPLTQFAESAGGLFGGLRFPGSPSPRPAPAGGVERELVETRPLPATSVPRVAAAATPAPRQTVARKSAAKKSDGKKDGGQEVRREEIGDEAIDGEEVDRVAGDGHAVGRWLSRSADERRGHHVARKRFASHVDHHLLALRRVGRAGTRTRCPARASARSCRWSPRRRVRRRSRRRTRRAPDAGHRWRARTTVARCRWHVRHERPRARGTTACPRPPPSRAPPAAT